MKRIILTVITLFLFFTAYATTFNSEVVKKVSYFNIKGNKLTQKDTVVLQINNRAGDNSAEIGIAYSKGDNVSINNAWIEDVDGNIIRKLKKSEIKKANYISGASLYQDYFIKSFNLKHNSYPYRVVYSYSITFSKYWWITSVDFTNANSYVKDYKITVEVPEDYEIKYKYKNIDEPITFSDGSYKYYTWNFSYTPEKTEWNSPSKSAIAPQITILPLNFKYGKNGSWNSWKTFGDWIVSLNKDRADLPDSEKATINKLIEGITDNVEKAKILYEYMQDFTRYINVNIKVGGMQTYPASYVCKNRYGDCKALSNYYQSMLKYAGIESFYTIIKLSDKIEDVDEDFPSQEFNHIILTIPFGKDTIYQECTSKTIPFGYTHTSIQGRKALLVSEGKSKLINIPEMGVDDVLCTRNISLSLIPSSAKIKSDYRGDKFELYNQFIQGVDKNNKDRYLQKSLINESYNLVDYQITKEYRNSTVVSIIANINLDNHYKKYGNSLILSPFTIPFPRYETVENRTKDFQIDYPQYFKDTITYNLQDFKIAKKPNNVSIETEFGHYFLNFEIVDNNLNIYKSILINKGRYPLSEYENLYKFLTIISSLEHKKYYLEVL